MTCNSHNVFFSNLANKTRFSIVMTLRMKPSSVNEITRLIGGEQSNVSHHLKQLVNCKILFVRKEGKKRIYSVNRDLIEPILQLIYKHSTKFCEGCKYRIETKKSKQQTKKKQQCETINNKKEKHNKEKREKQQTRKRKTTNKKIRTTLRNKL